MWKRYVAIGDSSTEGLDDPDGNGGYRGWADRLAQRIAEAQGSVEYANLAVRGRQTHEIRREQLPAALALGPDLATVVGGMNDLLRPRFDLEQIVRDLEVMYSTLAGAGATVVTFTLPSPGPGMPLAKLLQPRIARFNRGVRAAARRGGARVLDLAAHPVASDPRLWSEDKLHANSAGHERIAAGLAWTLEIAGTDRSWADALPRARRRPLSEAMVADAAWMRTHLAPWVVRRIRGTTSGDGVHPKYPQPMVVHAEAKT